MKKHIKNHLLIALFGILSLLFAVLAVVEAIPAKGSGLTVREEVTVSSSLLHVSEGQYITTLGGVIYNPTDSAITVDKWTITVHGDSEKQVVLDGVTVPPRTAYTIDSTWTESTAYRRVSTVVATVGGVDDLLPNGGSTLPVNGLVVVYLVFLAAAAGALVHFSKQRYYLWQEDRMRAEK